MSYRVPVLSRFSWQEPVANILSSAPGSPVKGDRFINSTDGKVNWFDGADWQADTPQIGWRIFNKSDATYYTYTATGWSSAQSAAGLTLTGDIDSTTTAINWKLKDNDANALSFDSEGAADILKFDTTDDAEKVVISKDLNVAGNATVGGNLTVNGTVTSINTVETTITDKNLILNKNGGVDSAGGAGLSFEEDGSITGYIEVAGTEDAFVLKAPKASGELTIKNTAVAVLNMAGNLAVEAASAINQDVTTDAAVQFGSVETTGGITAAGALSAGASTLSSLGVTGAATVGTTLGVTGKGTFSSDVDVAGVLTVTGSAALGTASATTLSVSGASTLASVSTSGDVSVGGLFSSAGAATFAQTIAVTGDATFSANLTDGTNSVTVANMKKAFDSRAKWDETLGCIVFDNAVLDAA